MLFIDHESLSYSGYVYNLPEQPKRERERGSSLLHVESRKGMAIPATTCLCTTPNRALDEPLPVQLLII